MKFNPLLIKSLNFRKRSFLKKDKPVWFDSVSLFPPPEKVSNFVFSGLETQFGAKERLNEAAKRQAFNSTRLNRRSKSILPKNTTKPPRIVYEEDEIRDSFFRQHPYELTRPKNLDVDYTEVHWDTIYGTPKQDLCGER
jgi:small subunit ribosomal protein S23